MQDIGNIAGLKSCTVEFPLPQHIFVAAYDAESQREQPIQARICERKVEQGAGRAAAEGKQRGRRQRLQNKLSQSKE